MPDGDIDLDAYFRRIGHEGARAPTLESLAAIQGDDVDLRGFFGFRGWPVPGGLGRSAAIGEEGDPVAIRRELGGSIVAGLRKLNQRSRSGRIVAIKPEIAAEAITVPIGTRSFDSDGSPAGRNADFGDVDGIEKVVQRQRRLCSRNLGERDEGVKNKGDAMHPTILASGCSSATSNTFALAVLLHLAL